MKKLNLFIGLIVIYVLISLVSRMLKKSPMPASYTPSRDVVTPSFIPYPVATLRPVQTVIPASATSILQAYPPRRRVTPKLSSPAAALPQGVMPLMSLAWHLNSGGSENITLIPYRNSDKQQSLAAIQQKDGRYSLYWDWQQESVGPDTWQEIRPLTNNPTQQNSITFLGLDPQGHWQIVNIGFFHRAILLGLIPVSNPERVFFITSKINHDDKTQTENWVIDGEVLHAYHWVNDKAILHWSLENLPTDAFIPIDFDLTGDGKPEWIFQWWRQNDRNEWRDRIEVFQILQTEQDGYRIIGELASEMQQIDLEGDGIPEFLRPLPIQAPQQWLVYRWTGSHFEWRETLARLSAPVPQTVVQSSLPAIPLDFYFKWADTFWRWPRNGGTLQSALKLPSQPSPNGCDQGGVAQAVISWSPKCDYALVSIQHYEGNSYSIIAVANGQHIGVPDSFVYVRGNSSFAWDPKERFIVHARADGSAGLYQIDLSSGVTSTLLGVSSSDVLNFDYFELGAVAPTVLRDSSVIFTVQGVNNASQYPPLGVYRITQDRQLTLLTEIPPLETANDSYDDVYYGGLIVSPDGSMYLYYASREGHQGEPYDVLILGLMDGSASWNLLEFIDAADFQWSNK